MNNLTTDSDKSNTRGGYTYQIDIAHILLTPSIENYLRDTIGIGDFESYSSHPNPKECGNLPRMERMNKLTDDQFAQLCQDNPIDVISIMMEYQDKETGYTEVAGFYEIINGRHRVTSAIARGLKQINARVKFRFS